MNVISTGAQRTEGPAVLGLLTQTLSVKQLYLEALVGCGKLPLANSEFNGSSFQTPMRLDSHQHFWHYSPTEHTWMTDQMGILKHAFLPQDLEPLLAGIHFDGCVAVQARQNLEETRWLLELAEQHPFIKGVVGWVDLRSEQLPGQLQRFATPSQARRRTPYSAR